MLESEYEELRIIHPEYARRWDAFLETWADKKGLPESFWYMGALALACITPENEGIVQIEGDYCQ